MTKSTYKITWNKYISHCYTLADYLQEYRDDHSAIITMPRGGYIPSSIISYQLKIGQIFSCGYQSYIGRAKKQKNIYQNLPNTLINFTTVFLIDDIIDTNQTMTDVNSLILKKNPKLKIYIASIFIKKQSKEFTKLYIEEIPNNVWVRFPYDN
jgi:xanthine phosphoribosyltransferase